MALPENNVKSVITALNWRNIKNANVQIGVLCCIAKESGFVPQNESSYKKTANDRLRLIFGTRLSAYTEDQLTALKTDDIKFFDAVYGNNNGNSAPGDGFKYRGRGFNQITFKNLYQKYGGMIGVDLVANPDLLNQIDNAAKACVCYFDTCFNNTAGKLKSRYGVDNVNEITDPKLGLQVAVNANAGWGKDTRGGAAEKAALGYFDQVTALYKKLTTA